MNLLLLHLSQSLRRPDHWIYASWLDIVSAYRKTYFGLLWLLIPTAVYIWGIGGYLGALQPGIDLRAFLARVGIGFVVYRLVSTVLQDATKTFQAHEAYILDGHLRLTDFLLRVLGRSLFYFLLTQPLLIFAVLGSPEFDWTGVPLSVGGLLVVVFNLFCLSVILGLLGARFQDLSEFVGSAMLAGFLITPIVWFPEAAPEGTMRGVLMRANPLHHLLAVVREPLLGHAIEPVTWIYLGAMSAAVLVAALWAYHRFARRVAVWL